MTLNTQYAYEAVPPNGELKKIHLPYDFKIYKEENHKYMSLQFSVEFKYNNQKHGYSTYVVDEALAHKTEQEIAYMLYDSFLKAFFTKVMAMPSIAAKAFRKRLAKCLGFEFDFDAVEKKPQKQMDFAKGPINFIGGYTGNDFYKEYAQKLEELKLKSKYVSYHYKSNPGAYMGVFTPFEKIEPHKVKGASAGTASKALPGVDTKVNSPCDCIQMKDTLWSIVIHLNDSHPTVWTREKIADWLDKLHDDGIVDIEFPVMTEEPVEAKRDFISFATGGIIQGSTAKVSIADETSGWKELGYIDETKEKK